MSRIVIRLGFPGGDRTVSPQAVGADWSVIGPSVLGDEQLVAASPLTGAYGVVDPSLVYRQLLSPSPVTLQTGIVAPAVDAGASDNEPAGMTQVTSRGWSALDEDGWGKNVSSDYTIESEAGAPESPPDVGQMFYEAPYSGGSSPTRTWKTFTEGNWKHVYVRFWHRVSANWQGHDSGVNKILYVVDPPTVGRPVIINWTHIDDGVATPQVRVQGDFPANWAYDQCDEIQDEAGDPVQSTSGVTEAEAALTPGQWHKWEVHMIANTGDNNDGSIFLWIDGDLILEYDGTAKFWSTTDEADRVWSQVKWDPVWGGTGDTTAEDQFQQIDHLYASVKE